MLGNHRVRIVARHNGVGLTRDVELIHRNLGTSCAVEHHRVRSLRAIGDTPGHWTGLDSRSLTTTNILVERIPLAWMVGPGQNLLIPNQERFPRRHIGRLRVLDAVLCKSRHAEKIFRQLNVPTRYIGFTSFDRRLTAHEPDYRKWLHLAGRSTLKGTQTVLELWAAHPEWPKLTLIQHAHNAPKRVPANVRLIAGYLEDNQLRRLQSTHGIQICPSLSEGWGHYIAEAMSCRAVVITTDAPPMNELVCSETGILVPWKQSAPRHLGTNFVVDPAALESTIQNVIESKESALERKGAQARAWFERNELAFVDRFGEVLDEFCGSSTRSPASTWWRPTTPIDCVPLPATSA